MAETYESKINSEHVQGWTRRTVADGDYLQSKTIQPLVNRDSILAKGLDDTNTLINGMSDKVDDVETKCNAQEALVKSLSGDVEDFCASATEAFEQIKANEQTLAGNVEDIQQSVNKLSTDVWQMNFMGFKDSTTVFVKEEIEQGKHMFSFSSVGGGGGGTSYDMAWYPSINNEGNMSWQWLQTTIEPTTKKVIPDFTVSDYHLYYTYADQPASTDWIDLGNIRGPEGQQGSQGPAGANACALTATSESVTDGTQVTISYTSGGNALAQFTVNNGQNGTNGAKGADACPISAKSTTTGKTHNVKIFYTSAANPDTNPLADFNVMDGEDGHGSSDVFDNTTISGNGSQETPYGVNTNVLATHTWVENQHYIANVTVNTTAFSGDGTSDNPLDLKINNPNSNKKYGYQPGTGWTEISEGGTVYDIIGNNGISAKKDTANDRYEVGLSGSYLPTLGGTVSGETILSGTQGNFDNSYLKFINNDSAYYARLGIGRYGGAVIKAGSNGLNPVQLNIKPSNNNNELVELQNNGSTVGFLIPATTANTTAGLTNDGILHIILES